MSQGQGPLSYKQDFCQHKRERIVEVCRIAASLFHGCRSDDERRLDHYQFVRSLIGDLPAAGSGNPRNCKSWLRGCPNDPRIFEVLLAFFVLRSIELELEVESSSGSTSSDDPRPSKRRRVEIERSDRSPLFRLPCTAGMLTKHFLSFCLSMFSANLSKQKCLLTLMDSFIPTTASSSMEAQTPRFQRSFSHKVNADFVASILRQWERRRVIILWNPGSVISQNSCLHNREAVLKSVSRPGLTQILAASLAELGMMAQRPVPASTTSIYHARDPVALKSPTGPIPNLVPPPPPPPPIGVGPPASGDSCGTLSTSNNALIIKRLLDSALASQLMESNVFDLVETLPVKALLDRPTMHDLLTKTLLIPSPTDSRFSLLKFCEYSSRDLCVSARRGQCKNVHYKKLIQSHTDVSLGDCSYLDTCRHVFSCKFVHYAVDLSAEERKAVLCHPNFKHRTVLLNQFDVLERSELLSNPTGDVLMDEEDSSSADALESWFENGVIRLMGRDPTPPQWIRCDMRSLNLGIFRGLVSVVMADPPWDIRMDLPYGTMTDTEMKNLRVDLIQDQGLLFLWVTGRAMEIARDCMTAWGYSRVDELVWVKTNHLHRIIRTGRTGHWLNHSKEHCLIGIKGNPKIFRNVDCDVVVSEVRETSRKPDEIYRLIERMAPHGLKLELFGRQHNLRQNWVTLGNQLDGVSLHTPQLVKAFKECRHGLRQVRLEEGQRVEAAAKKLTEPSIDG